MQNLIRVDGAVDRGLAFILCIPSLNPAKVNTFYMKKCFKETLVIPRVFKWVKPALFCIFSFFSYEKYGTYLSLNDKSIGGVLGAARW